MKTNLIILKFIILALLCAVMTTKAHGQPTADYVFSNLTIKDGLSQLSVIQIHQDYQGYIWFGTRNGLDRYDGNDMKVYKHNSSNPEGSLLDNQIAALAEDKSHNLWVGTSQGLSRLDLTTDRIYSYSRAKHPYLADRIRALCVDKAQNLWIGTTSGLFKISHSNLQQVRAVSMKGMPKNTAILAIRETTGGYLLLGTGHGLYAYKGNRLKRIFSERTKNLSGHEITRIYEDSRHNIWVGTKDGGLNRVDLLTGKNRAINTGNSMLQTNVVRDVVQMSNSLLIGTYEGLYVMDLNTGAMRHVANQQGNGVLSHFSIYSLLCDKSHGLWVGTYSGGVNYYSKYNARFKFLQPSVLLHTYLGTYGQLLPLGNDRVMIATEGTGILEYTRSTGALRLYPYFKAGNMRSHNIIKSISDWGGDFMCGTTEGEVLRFSPQSNSYKKEIDLGYTTSIYAVEPDGRGGMWLASSTGGYGLVHADAKGHLQKTFNMRGRRAPFAFPSLRCIFKINNTTLLLGSRSNGLYRYDTARGTITQFATSQKGRHHISSDYITAIVTDRRGRIWVATFGGGLFRYDDRRGIIGHVGKAQGLPTDEISMVVLGHDGNLWMSLDRDVASLNPDNLRTRTYPIGMYDVEEFSPHSGTCLPDGTICFSASNGVLSFSPTNLPVNTFSPQIVLNTLSVNNHDISPSENGILTRALNETESIELSYDENNISICYCALNYVFPNLNQYAYRLVGHDKEWNYVGNHHTVHYSNLSPGKYVFELRAANNDGVWSDGVRRLTITINPPIWATWYAYLFYLIVVGAVLYTILYYVNKKRKLEQTLTLEKREKEQREKLNKERMNMYTNFSHELRTPLQLILSPLEELLKNQNVHMYERNKLELIYNNAQRMLSLVNKLMDLQKTKAGKMELKVNRGDLSAYVSGICEAFKGVAEDKGISLTYHCPEESMMVWFDRFGFEKVVFNLLSNAMKFTPQGGKISVELKPISRDALQDHPEWLQKLPEGAPLVELSVADNGESVPDKDLKKIFRPFYQSTQITATGGTGIGLSLTKSVVAMHHGVIGAANLSSGGVCFSVIIPNDKALYKPEEIDQSALNVVAKEVLPPVSKVKVEQGKRYNVLLVEDNDDVRKYISDCLKPYFEVTEASNGVEATAKLDRNLPDIIVSDVMMPQKNGMELCREVKENMSTCHIPFIMMTARSFAEHIVEGYATGADDYIVKPFNIDILVSRIYNILKSRERLKEIYGRKFSPEEMGIEVVEDQDDFVQRFFKVITDNISNTDLDVDMICKELGVSRTNLYRKMKAVTPLSPVELIRSKRLEVAAQLLTSSDISIFDVAIRTGFNSQAYFSKCFRTQFGCTPTEYITKHKKEKE